MINEQFETGKRSLKTIRVAVDFVIAGGGMSGVCAAITAARAGIKVALFQDRPVLGGNASSEVRLWILGATSHMGNNNRWAREGGVINEILVENIYRNKEGNPVVLDTIILEKVKNEPNISLFLNTMVYDVDKNDSGHISRLYAFCSQNETFYEAEAPLFCDASGDGILAYRAGASYRMGAEDRRIYNEQFAPDTDEYGELLGHSIYFYSKDTGKPVRFTPPSYALKDISRIPRFGNINSGEHGCKFWWLEFGGRKDTIHDTEEIKWELWSVVYGVWDYIKNSGKFPEAENYALEWVGTIPGKRESRRFLGYYTLTQQDIIQQTRFEDAVAFGGWAIDLHPADGVYSNKSGCIQYHSKGIYEIPYRCYISKDIGNLFFAGRNISTSHVAHGSSRVMATSALGAQAVGMAAAHCLSKKLQPAGLLEKEQMKDLQQALNLAGQSIPHVPIDRSSDLAASAAVEASGILSLDELEFNGPWYQLDYSVAQLLPMTKNTCYRITVETDASEFTELHAELRYSSGPYNYTPDCIAEHLAFRLRPGMQKVTIGFSKSVPGNQYGFVTFLKNENIKLKMSEERITGLVSVFNKFNRAVNNHGKQTPPPDSGIDTFEFWCPDRRPAGQNIAMGIYPAIACFGAANLFNGRIRPATCPNAWVAAKGDPNPVVSFTWKEPQEIREITLYFDTDYDHPMESVQMGHPEDVIPFCVRNYRIYNSDSSLLFEKKDNYQTINPVFFDNPIKTNMIRIELVASSPDIPVSLFEIRIN